MQARILIQPEVLRVQRWALDDCLSAPLSHLCEVNNWDSLHAFWQCLYRRHLSKNCFIGVLDPSRHRFYYQEFIFRGESADFIAQRSQAIEKLKNDSGFERPADCIIFGVSSGLDGGSERNVCVLPGQPLPPILQYIKDVVCLSGGVVVPTFQEHALQHGLQVDSAGDAKSQSDAPILEGGQFGGVAAQHPSSSWTLLNIMCRPEVAAMSGAFLAFGLLTLATGGSSLVVMGGSSLFVKIGIASSVIGGAGLAGHFFAKKTQLPLESIADGPPPPYFSPG